MKELARSIYIDALSLVPKNKSGVGITLQQTLQELTATKVAKDRKIYLVVPLGKARHLKKYTGAHVQTKTIFLPARILQSLMKMKLLPPVDWFLGSGVYVFPNYRNWPLWRSRSLTYIYDTVFLSYPETVQPKNQKYLSRYIHMWLGRTDRVITISEQVKLELEKLLKVFYGKIDIVPCGVDTKIYKRKSLSEIDAAKNKYGIPYEKYLLFVGNIEPRKNLIALMDAYSKLPPRLQQEYGLVIVGADGWLKESFQQKFASMQQAGLNVFKVKEYVEGADLPAIYSGAALLVHPAIYEGFGMTPLEAMACQAAVAVSDIPAIREVVESAGEYFDPSDTDSIRQAIVKILDNTKYREELVDAGLARAKSLSWSNSAARLAESIEGQFKAGSNNHPLLMRARTLYARADRLIRRLLGDRPLDPYRPAPANSQAEMRRQVYDDFVEELPAGWRIALLKFYLATRHAASRIAKSIYGLARAGQ